MTGRRAAELGRGVASLAALLLLTLGPPVGLVALVGWPLPTTVPSMSEIGDALKLGIGDAAVVKTLAVLAWLAWAQVAVSVAAETVAVARGRSAERLPILPGIQASVGRLVAGVTMIGSTTLGGAHVPPAAATAVPPVEPIALVTDTQVAAPGAPAQGRAVASPSVSIGDPVTPANAATIEVQPRDSYWAIAERLYGDGLRWREIRDANVGRTMPDGRVVEASSDLVMPGWLLLVPGGESAGAADLSGNYRAPSQGTGTPAAVEVSVQPGDSMWRLAETHLTNQLGRAPTPEETAAYCGPFIEANRGRLVDPSTPDLIYPGQTFLLATPAEAPPTDVPVIDHHNDEPAPEVTPETMPELNPTTTSTDPPAATSTTSSSIPAPPLTSAPAPPAPTAPALSPDRDESSQHDDTGSALSSAALATIAGTALAVGIARAVRRRRRQRNHDSPGLVPHPSPDEQFHRQVVAAADEDAVDALASALTHLAGGLAESGQECRPLIVQQGPGRVDVFLDAPSEPAVEGWKSIGVGEIWTVDSTSIPTDGTRRWTTPAPLLVSLGRPDDAGQIYLDLEAAGVTTLTGDQALRLDLLRTIAAELAHSPLGEATQTLVVGDLGVSALLDECEQVTVVDTWDEAIEDLSAWAEQSRAALASSGCYSSFAARHDEPDDDSLVPLVVLAAQPPPSPDALAFLQPSPAAAAAVVISDDPLPNSTIVICSPDELLLPQIGLGCIPQAFDQEQLDNLTDLLVSASDPAGAQLELSLQVDHPGDLQDSDEEAAGQYEDPPYDVLVRFLGDITVEGDLRRPLVAKEIAAVAYIALHGSVTVDRVEDALWASPRTDSRRRRLVHMMSLIRSALRNEHLPTAKDGHYAIGPRVMTDLDLFDARVEAANRDPRHAVAVDLLLDALSLCTGQVFHYQSRDQDSYGWVESGNLQSHWEVKLTRIAQELAEQCIGDGDPHRAIEACEAGLRAIPTDRACTEALMRAHAADGNLVAVQHVYQAHVAALELIHLDQVAASTADLYEQLRRSTE